MDEQRFGPFEGRIWLNTAHQGALPRVAREAADRALDEKQAPHRIADDAFFDLPRRLKTALARLVGGRPEEIVLGNSASHGLHVLAQGIGLRAGDEVLLVDGDFPATVTPWLPLRRRGVDVRLVDLDALEASISDRTRVLCSSWVFSLSGHAIDLEAVGRMCRERGVRFVVNGSQAVGTRPIDVAALPVDALVCCGFKWLCGPYGTGFAWIREDLLGDLETDNAYWLAQMGESDLASLGGYTLRDDLGAERFDVFGTANFLNFAPWLAAVDLLLETGIERIAAHNQSLVDRLVVGLGDRVASPLDGPARSTLVLARPADAHAALTEAGIDCAVREGALRFSPHLYNDEDDVDAVLDVMTRARSARRARAPAP